MISHILEKHAEDVAEALQAVAWNSVDSACEILKEARKENQKVWLAGNGGSAATASHFANDLVKMCGVKAIPLTDLTSLMLAYANDDGWHVMFRNMILKMASGNDVVVLFSCSGNSINVVKAVPGTFLKCIAFTGDSHITKLVASNPGCVIYAPHPDIRVQEDIHMILCHAIVGALKK